MPRGHNESDNITWHVVIGSNGLDQIANNAGLAKPLHATRDNDLAS